MKLPALYRPQSMQQTPQQLMQGQLRTLESQLAKLEAEGQGSSERAKQLRAQIGAVKARMQSVQGDGADAPSDAKRIDADGAPAVKQAPKILKPGGGEN